MTKSRNINVYVNFFLICRYVNAKEKEEKLSLVEMQLKLQADMNKKLSFNPHLYKASHVVS